MKLLAVALPLTLFLCSYSVLPSEVTYVTFEDIYKLLKSVKEMQQGGADRLARHEYRERSLGTNLTDSLLCLGEQGRRHEEALASLNGRLSLLDSKIDHILYGEGVGRWTARLDALASSVEQLLNRSPTPTPAPVVESVETNEVEFARLQQPQHCDCNCDCTHTVAGLATREELAALINGTHKQLHNVKHKIIESTDKGFTKVSDLVQSHSKELKATISDNQSGAHSDHGMEMNQMGGQLDSLLAKVNGNGDGSLLAKVGQIAGRMGEVDDDLNYLLGRMSVVAREADQAKRQMVQSDDADLSSHYRSDESP